MSQFPTAEQFEALTTQVDAQNIQVAMQNIQVGALTAQVAELLHNKGVEAILLPPATSTRASLLPPNWPGAPS